MVGYFGPVVSEDLRWCGVVFAEPCRGSAEHFFNGHAESAVAGAEFAEPHAATNSPLRPPPRYRAISRVAASRPTSPP